MPSSSQFVPGRVGVLLALALSGVTCRGDQASPSDAERQAEGSTRRGVEPAPARGEDRDEPAGGRLPDERTQSTMVLRGRIEGLDQKLALLRNDLELQQRSQALATSLEEERRRLDEDFGAMQRASESEWKDLRDRIDRRLESMTATVDRTRETASAGDR